MGGRFDLETLQSKINDLEKIYNSSDFWNDSEKATSVSKELSDLKKVVLEYNKVKNAIDDNLELLAMVDESDITDIVDELPVLEKQLENLELSTLLNGEFDNCNCFLEVHSGAGGTEACDWASMLLRMYERFCEKNDYSYEVIEEQKGEEAGLKSGTILIKGHYAYGYFKNETGIHRLVRISPFDSNKRRHTSFASVSVTPEINQEINLEVNESDLKIDVYHSSGAGGQSVNTSNSAVRITHLPTKIVVTCQNERSQMKNKDMAMKLLKSKLYQLEQEKKAEEMARIKGEALNINFGSQSRNYVLEPYKQVKDLRSGYTTSNAMQVLDGDLLEIMKSLLKGDFNE